LQHINEITGKGEVADSAMLDLEESKSNCYAIYKCSVLRSLPSQCVHITTDILPQARQLYQVTKALGLLPRSMHDTHLSADCSHQTRYYVASSLQQDAEDERVRSDVINMGLFYIVDLLHNDTIISICARSDIPIPASSLHIAQVRILHSARVNDTRE